MNVAIYGDHVIMCPSAAAWVQAQGVPPSAIMVGKRAMHALPHTFDAVRLFRNCGVELPTRIKAGGYEFPGRFKPFEHQVDTADFLAGYEKAFCLSSPGTGKTAAAIWAADYLQKLGVVRRVLVICPMSCMSAVWQDELFGTVPHRSAAVLHGGRAVREKLIGSSAEWLIINHDGIKVVTSELADPASQIDLVILDEQTAMKSESTGRVKALKRIVAGRRLWALSGTPIPQNPVDAYTMCKLINPKAPQHKYHFQDETMRKVSNYRWVPKIDATEKVYSFMQPAVRYSKAECMDMPPVMHIQRRVDTTAAQDKALDSMRRDWVADVRTHGGAAQTVTAQNAAIRMGKMLQILQGIIIGNDKSISYIDASPRYEACYDAIMESATKSIVFVPYKGALEKLRAYLTKRGLTCAVVDGDVAASARTAIFHEFQNLSDPKVLIAHPKTTSHGLTLTAASTTIWFGATFSNETFEQANNRTNRPGQLHDMRVIQLYSGTLESTIFKNLQGMSDVQNDLLSMYKREVESA